MKGSDVVGRSLLAHGVEDIFFIVGGPITGSIWASIEAGIRGIDVRDERAAAFAAVAYSRLRQKPGVVMSCSGPGTTNTVTGVAHAFADGAPVVVLGGSTAQFQRDSGAFQDTDQVGLMRPITKWSHQVTDADGISEAIARAFQIATTGAPGPVYVDLPADVLYADVADDVVITKPRPPLLFDADAQVISAAADRIVAAERPIVIAGSGVIWSKAWSELQAFVEVAGIPFYTTPIASGVIAEDHRLSFQAARSAAFRQADLIVVVGSRDNYVLNFLRPPVMNPQATIIEINGDPAALSKNRLADVAILADARAALRQLAAELSRRGVSGSYPSWEQTLSERAEAARARSREQAESDEIPIHPLRLATAVNAAVSGDAIRVLDGRDTLAFGRRAFATNRVSGLLNPGVYGTMGVGVPFALGAKVACPDDDVIALVGDGAFGYHVMELDTAVRHHLGFVCVVANNAGWTAARDKAGHELGYSDYDRLADVVGCWGARVSKPEELDGTLKEALEYVRRENKPAVVNVIMASIDSSGRSFSSYTRNSDAKYEAV